MEEPDVGCSLCMAVRKIKREKGIWWMPWH